MTKLLTGLAAAVALAFPCLAQATLCSDLVTAMERVSQVATKTARTDIRNHAEAANASLGNIFVANCANGAEPDPGTGNGSGGNDNPYNSFWKCVEAEIGLQGISRKKAKAFCRAEYFPNA